MPQTGPQAERPAQSTTPKVFPAGLAMAGKRRVEDMIDLQTEVFDYLQEVNRNWFAHIHSEAAIASEIANKLTEARSMPETATLYREWANRRMELFAEDGKRLIADTEKLLETGARLLADGWVQRNP
jgi:Phasin protein